MKWRKIVAESDGEVRFALMSPFEVPCEGGQHGNDDGSVAMLPCPACGAAL